MEPINAFPEYEFRWEKDAAGRNKPHNYYRGVDLGFGGYVYAEPGMYTDVAVCDSQSHHPTSAIQMNYFGDATPRFNDILQTRLLIKHGKLEEAAKLFDGRLAKYLKNPETAGQLSQALKIAINSAYGLTSAKFDNPLFIKDNVNNIVALRGAIFLKLLKDEVDSHGGHVISIRTDSCKIPNATKELIDFVQEVATPYGYSFEFESSYERMCLVDNTNYIAKYNTPERCMELYGYVPSNNRKHPGEWTATGAKFAQPFVFKTLFAKERIEFRDLCEVKEVSGASILLDFNEGLPDVSLYENELSERAKNDTVKSKRLNADLTEYSDDDLRRLSEPGHDYKFIGRIGLFTPIQEGFGGGIMLSNRKGKKSAINGTKGYRWMESENVVKAGLQDKVDMSYYRGLVDDALEEISRFGDHEWFCNGNRSKSIDYPPCEGQVPWYMPCKDPTKTVCEDCPNFETCEFLEAERKRKEDDIDAS